jgi:hypothetical protein
VKASDPAYPTGFEVKEEKLAGTSKENRLG